MFTYFHVFQEGAAALELEVDLLHTACAEQCVPTAAQLVRVCLL